MSERELGTYAHYLDLRRHVRLGVLHQLAKELLDLSSQIKAQRPSISTPPCYY